MPLQYKLISLLPPLYNAPAPFQDGPQFEFQQDLMKFSYTADCKSGFYDQFCRLLRRFNEYCTEPSVRPPLLRTTHKATSSSVRPVLKRQDAVEEFPINRDLLRSEFKGLLKSHSAYNDFLTCHQFFK